MIGILGGTSFFDTDILHKGDHVREVTPYGVVDVFIAGNAAMIARHGIAGTTPPHRINHRAHLSAMRQLGARGLISFGSVGGLNEMFKPGVQALISDFYAPYRTVSFHENSMRVTIPDLTGPWHDSIARILHDNGSDIVDDGVYAETLGLRFETRAEVRVLAQIADVVGMTCASEATLASELDLPVAIIATVDNYAHGLGLTPLTGDVFSKTIRENRDNVLNTFSILVKHADDLTMI